ncbi:fungal-specific transcription factor domain-containing protein [Rhexocercosporidium sp. MPI-PUGE-AT-0058]|nr:fungal-specific transcription factor domain-containing protein [Rhexocercosporidium sp. MPI-PUGE-AT-0058]
MADSSNPKRRRGPAFVTPNACTECRTKRTKCNGNVPCGRCASHGGLECVYEVPTRQSKEDMRKEISQLRAQQRQTEHVLGVLASREHPEEVLDRLRHGDALQNLTASLRGSPFASAALTNVTTYARLSDREAINSALEPAQNIGKMPSATPPFQEASQMPPQSQQNDPSEPGSAGPKGDHLLNDLLGNRNAPSAENWTIDSTYPTFSSPCYPAVGIWHGQPSNPLSDGALQPAMHPDQDHIPGHGAEPEYLSEPPEPKQDDESWTTVTCEKELVEHLLALYFCWEYPIFATLSKEHFLDDFRLGIPRYCSRLLVNALLALGCRSSDRPSARSNLEDSATAGDHFFAEALKLLEAEEDHRALTTIQALGIMSIREASCGRISESIFFSGQSIRLAIEMGLHLAAEGDNDDSALHADKAVRGATFWGAFSLDEAWSLCSGKLPHFSPRIHLIIKPAIIPEIESMPWVLYTDDGAPLEQNCTQPSNLRSVYETFCELSEIVHRALYTLHTPSSNTISKPLLNTYSQYILWYDKIPDALRLGYNFTPAVLFAHLYYHFAILILFRPFVRPGITTADVSPRHVCTQAANAISAIIRSYSNLYTLRRTPSFVPYVVFSSSIFHLAIVREDQLSTHSRGQLIQSISDLKEMSSCHGFAARALDILRFLASLWEGDEPTKPLSRLFHPHGPTESAYRKQISFSTQCLRIFRDSPVFDLFPIHGGPTGAPSSELEDVASAALPVQKQA